MVMVFTPVLHKYRLQSQVKSDGFEPTCSLGCSAPFIHSLIHLPIQRMEQPQYKEVCAQQKFVSCSLWPTSLDVQFIK